MIRMACHLFQGILEVTMSHNEAWHFIRLGTGLERADKTSRMLDVKYFILLPAVADVGTPFDDVQWSRRAEKRQRFRDVSQAVRAHLAGADCRVSIAQQRISTGGASLHPGGGPVAAHHHGNAYGIVFLRLRTAPGPIAFRAGLLQRDEIISGGLHEFCDTLQAKMNTIDECILGDFFAQRPAAMSAGAAPDKR